MAFQSCCPFPPALIAACEVRQLLGLSAASPEVPPWPVKLQAPSPVLTLHCRWGSFYAILLHVLAAPRPCRPAYPYACADG